MTDVVLDASAILAVVFEEPGAERVADYLPLILYGAAAQTNNSA